MASDKKARVLSCLHNEGGPGFPIWLMRQAGRFLPEYREIRKPYTFTEFIRSPAMCTEAALQPLRRFDLDATIVFSDILTIPDAMGAGLAFVAGDGPTFTKPVRTDADFEALDPTGLTERLEYVYEAVRALRVAAPDYALFGFAGSPWTLFCYLVQGHGSSDFPLARAMLWANPTLARRLLSTLADAVADHLLAQHAAGADVVQVFDSWGGLLPADVWAEWTGPGLRRITERLGSVPSVLYVRAGAHLVDASANLGFNALSVHETVDVGMVAGRGIPTQGNVDPTLMYGPPELIHAKVAAIAASLGRRRSHIYNLGHGILPTTPISGVQAFVDAVRALA